MKGNYNLVLGDSKIVFDLCLEHSITIIKGDSGTGKTTLYEYSKEVVLSRTAGIYCNLKDKLFVLDINKGWDRVIKNNSGKIIIVDEWITDIMQTKEFADYVNNGCNYFILISRSGRFRHIHYSNECVYELNPVRVGNITHTSLCNKYIGGSSKSQN